MDVAALIVAALALGFSVYAFWRQFSLQGRVTEIEEARRQEEVAAALQAYVTARFGTYSTERGAHGNELVLTNEGPARAEKVSFELVRASGGEYPHLMMEAHDFPIALAPGQDYRIKAVIVMGTAPVVDLVVWWTDGTGQREARLTLNVV